MQQRTERELTVCVRAVGVQASAASTQISNPYRCKLAARTTKTMPTQKQLASEICAIGRSMVDRQFVAAHEGNVSARMPDGQFLCTPTLRSKSELAPDDLCVIDTAGDLVEPSASRPTSEIKLHLSVYQHRPDVQAVVHSHAPHATAFAIARQTPPAGVLAELDLYCGPVALAPYALPGSEAMAESIVSLVAEHSVILLSNHGVVTYGKTLEQAFWLTEVLDAACRTILLSQSLGGPVALPADDARALAGLRSNFGF